MLTKRMFWMSVGVASAAASVMAWLMIRAADEFPRRDASVVQSNQATDSRDKLRQTKYQSLSDFLETITAPPPADGKVSSMVGKSLLAALQAIKQHDFAKAKSWLAQAESVSNKSLYEIYKINEVWMYFFGQQRDYKSLLRALEERNASADMRQFIPDNDPLRGSKILAMLAASSGDYPKASVYGEQWLADHKDDALISSLVTQSYYSIKDYRSCSSVAAGAIRNAEADNERPSEALLTFLRSCASQSNDVTSALWALEKLCQYYPKPANWQAFIRAKSKSSSEFSAYYFERLLLDVDALADPDDYANLAQQSCLSFDLPNFGARVLQNAIAAKLFDKDARMRTRVDSLLTQCHEVAKREQDKLPTLLSDVATSPAGKNEFAVGMFYFDIDQLEQAESALTIAVDKGGFSERPHAQMTLAITLLKQGNRDASRTVLRSVAQDPSNNAVANAWIVRTYNPN